uniref:PNT domain-containing protein n=1 Tax=Ascaris lumbricoides TaxID=6252 RepID=A0A9J2PCU3_ASCLU
MTNVIKKRVKLESDSMASPRCRPRIEMSEDVHQQPLTSTANPLLSLTPGTKSKFADILKHSYSKFDIERQQSNIPADPTLWTLAQTSTWIDWARKEFNVVDRCDQVGKFSSYQILQKNGLSLQTSSGNFLQR